MKVRRAQAIFLCLIISGVISACGSGSLAPGVDRSLRSLQSIEVVPSQPSISLGENQQFTAIGHYRDGTTKDLTASATWATSNTSVASLSASGLAESHATGSATISATSSGMAGSGTLTVTKATLLSITITPADPVMLLGTVQQFTATGKFSDQSTQDITASVVWVSSNPALASISAGGLGSALALGSLTISATSGSVSASTPVSVQPAGLASITIRPEKGKTAQLTTRQFQAIGNYTDGSTHNVTGEVSWTSSDTGVATIGRNGLASALSPGTTTISAALGSISASATLQVTNARLVSIAVRPPGRTIAPLTRLSFIAIGFFSDRTSQVITRESAWASDNPAVAMIRAGSTAIAVAPGIANISATLNGVTGSAPLNVSSATLLSITVTPASAVLAPTTFVSCTATGNFSDGSTQLITNIVTWTSSAPTVASVGGGRVTALSGGSATITAQLGSVSGESRITVDSLPLKSIQISPPTASIPQQTEVAFRAIGTFADGNTQDLTTFALWTVSPPSVATINAGQATGLAPGKAVVTALFGEQVGTASLTVTAATATSLEVSPSVADFEAGSLTQLNAIAVFSDGTTKDVTPWVTWTSSSANVADVSPTGLATATAAGTTTVTATMNGLNGTAVLAVH